MKAIGYLLLATVICVPLLALAGTTGKIVGTARDARTGEPLPSVNVVVEGSNLGAASNVDGYFVILNVPPGRCRVIASLVGYKSATAVDVRVDIDQTTTQNFSLAEETVTTEEIMVVAQRPVVQRDVAASRANIEIKEVEKLPVATVVGAVGLQAGVQGLSIRGGTASELSFMVNGTMMRDERTNTPYTSVSLLSVQDIQVTTGGFSAEYGQVRSGVVNVVTKEGSRSNYSAAFLGRYSPTSPKHFGPSIYDKNSYWIRPYLDDAVAWTGTQNGAWDRFTLKQFPAFEGWNAISQRYVSNTNPGDDLTPQALQRLFEFQRRKIAEVNAPDYDIDATVGGPIPFIGEETGNLRFFASYRESQNMYMIPLSDDAYRDKSGSLKLTSDIGSGMKLSVEGVMGRLTGTNNNNAGNPGMFQTPADIGAVLNRVSYIDTRIFATDYWAPSMTDILGLNAKFTHNPNAHSWYDVSVSVQQFKYQTNPGRFRDTEKKYLFGESYLVDESPFGFAYLPDPASGLADIRFGVGFSNSRDTSTSTQLNIRFNYETQLDRYNQVKAGAEFWYTDMDVKYGLYDAFLKDNVFNTAYRRFPIKGAIYLRDKLEFEGMVADLGLRADYLNPQGEWYVYDAYTSAFSGKNADNINEILPTEKIKTQLLLSPRLGVSFPISETAKLYFNYGHFYQQPVTDNIFLLRQSGFDKSIVRIGDPSQPLPRTIAYELGYEQSLSDEYLLRAAAYYKDISDETRYVSYENRNSSVAYDQYTSTSYRDIRGIEFSAYKNRGNWIQGFVNYTYNVVTSGYFDKTAYYQNQQQQAISDRANVYQQRPIPQPYARLNLDLFTPAEYGPSMGGLYLLGDWRVNFVGGWSSGYYLTWAGGASIPGLVNNVQWSDAWNMDMRITKNFQFGRLNLQLFADISNLTNYKYMTQYGFVTSTDYNDYMQSLHLPAFPADLDQQVGYVNINGSDHPGMYRKEGSTFQPIIPYRQYSAIEGLSAPEARPYYYAADRNQYYQFVNGQWQAVDAGKLQQVLDDKAYIDMPNMESFWFLNPRRVYWGLRVTFDI
jgi:outer membrane receptor protein involved in Fe transport